MSKERNESRGKYPPDLENLPGEIQIDDIPGSVSDKELETKAREHLKSNPHIFEKAKEKGQDLVAFSSSHKVIIIGVGVAVLTSIGAILLYKHRSDKK